MEIPFTTPIAAFLTALPIFLFLISRALNSRYKQGGYLYGSISNAFLFETILFVLINIYLATIGTSAGWENLTSNLTIIVFWIPLIVSPFVAIKLNSKTSGVLDTYWFFIYFLLSIVLAIIINKSWHLFNSYYIERIKNIISEYKQ